MIFGPMAMTNMRISTDSGEFDIAMVHRFLAEESYWAKGCRDSCWSRQWHIPYASEVLSAMHR